MPLNIPPDLWHRLCVFLATHEHCRVILDQHQGRVCKLELVETVKASQGHSLHVGEMPTYGVDNPVEQS